MSCLIACSRAARRPPPCAVSRGVARRADRERDQVVDVIDEERSQLEAGDRVVLLREADVVGEQPQGRRAGSDAAQAALVRARDARRDLRSGKAQRQEMAGRLVHQAAGPSQGEQGRLAIAEHDLILALAHDIAAAHVHRHREVVEAVGEAFARAPVVRAVHLARHHQQAGQHLQLDVDVERDVARGLDLVAHHGAPEELAVEIVSLPLGRVAEREPDWLGRRRRAEQHLGREHRRPGQIAHGRHLGWFAWRGFPIWAARTWAVCISV